MTTAQLVSTAFVIATLVAPIGVPAQNNAAPGSAAQSNSQPVPATSPAPSNAPVDHRGDTNHGDTSSDRPTLQERYPRYLVTRSDVLALSFPLSPEFNRNVTVQPDGYINLQGTRSVYVQGMTVPEIIAAIKKAYEHVLRDPIIDVDLVDFQKPYFIAGGQVSKPGPVRIAARYHRVAGHRHGGRHLFWRQDSDFSLSPGSPRLDGGQEAELEGHLSRKERG